jgi:putative FmdB family regulatory protein
MPTYQYECKLCPIQIEELQKVDDSPLVMCPSCEKPSLFRVITGGLGFFMTGRTVGAIADKNADSFSKDYKSRLANKNKTKKVDTLSKKMGNKGQIIKSNSTEKPWYKKNQKVSDKQLQSASAEQLKTYIEKGKL